jgi:hypothetical protein
LLDKQHDTRVAYWIVYRAFAYPETRRVAYSFLKRNLDGILANLPADWGAQVIDLLGSFTDPAMISDAAAFFADRAPKLLGGPRTLAQSLEAARLNVAQRERHAASIAQFFAARRQTR